MENILSEKIIEQNDKFKIVEITKEVLHPSLYGNELRIIDGITVTVFVNIVTTKKKIFF